MSSKRKGKKLKLVAALVFLLVSGSGIVSAQTAAPPTHAVQADTTKDIRTGPASIPAGEEARLKKFLDKNGGYKDKEETAITIRKRPAIRQNSGRL